MNAANKLAETCDSANETEGAEAVATHDPAGYIYPTGQAPRGAFLKAARRHFSVGNELGCWVMLMDWAARAIVHTGKSSRGKGQAAERELFRLLSDELGFVVRRNVDQARIGGADCIELPGFAPEVKRHEKLAFPAWWRQAVKQGTDMQAEPIVFFRRSREEWRALIRTVDGGFRVAEWAAAVMHVREKIARLYGMTKEAA